MKRARNLAEVYKGRQPTRPHYIEQWAEKRGYSSQTELAEAIGADKSVVNRWYSGTSPTTVYQEKLAALFDCEPEALFRHPDDDWLTRFFQNRTADEVQRAKAMLEAAFPPPPHPRQKTN